MSMCPAQKLSEYSPKVGNTGACSFPAIWLLKSWRSLVTPLCTGKPNYFKMEIIRRRSPFINKPHSTSGVCFCFGVYLQQTELNWPSINSYFDEGTRICSVLSIDMDITEVQDLKKCSMWRLPDLRICGSGTGNRHYIWINSKCLTETEQGITDHGASLTWD